MHGIQWIETFALALSLVLAAMSAAAETALTALSPATVHSMAEHGGVGQIIANLKRDPNRFLSTILIISSSSLIVGSSMATLLLTSLLPSPWGEVAATVGDSIVVLILAEITPKNLAVRRPRTLALALARPVQWLSIILMPINIAIGSIVSVLMRLMGQEGGSHTVPTITEDDVRATISLAEHSEGGLTEEETERIEGILDLGNVIVEQVMRPRVDIIAVPAAMLLMDALDVVLREGHSRIPVYEENIDQIVGVLYDKDLLRFLRQNEINVSLRDVARPAIYVPESKRADDLLREFQKRKVHMAIVVDEYGGTAGLVTIEDILEEIVGEIQDEYDVEEVPIIAEDEDRWLVDAGLRLDEINEELGLDLGRENGVETLGGLVIDQLGDIPTVGDSISVDRINLEVVNIEGRRIKKVRIVRYPDPTPLDDLDDGD